MVITLVWLVRIWWMWNASIWKDFALNIHNIQGYIFSLATTISYQTICFYPMSPENFNYIGTLFWTYWERKKIVKMVKTATFYLISFYNLSMKITKYAKVTGYIWKTVCKWRLNSSKQTRRETGCIF